MMLDNEKEMFEEMFEEKPVITLESLSENIAYLQQACYENHTSIQNIEQLITTFGKSIYSLESRVDNLETGLRKAIHYLGD
jgi:uncharacterized protein Yka (UPF0111/DUF47 family)